MSQATPGRHVRIDPRVNCAPPGFNPATDLPKGFYEFLLPLHREFTRRQQALTAKRAESLARAHAVIFPITCLPPPPRPAIGRSSSRSGVRIRGTK